MSLDDHRTYTLSVLYPGAAFPGEADSSMIDAAHGISEELFDVCSDDGDMGVGPAQTHIIWPTYDEDICALSALFRDCALLLESRPHPFEPAGPEEFRATYVNGVRVSLQYAGLPPIDMAAINQELRNLKGGT